MIGTLSSAESESLEGDSPPASGPHARKQETNSPEVTDHSAPTRDQILRAASRLFAEQGFHATSTRDIAAAVGIRQPSLFHHFSSKAEIMAELQRLEFETSIRVFEAARRRRASAGARLFGAVFTEVRRMISAPYDFTCTTTAEVLNEPALADQRVLWEAIMGAQAALIAEGATSGELIEIDPDFASRGVDWLIEGVLTDARRRDDLDPSEFADQVASFALRALLAAGARRDKLRDDGLAMVEELEAEAGIQPPARN